MTYACYAVFLFVYGLAGTIVFHGIKGTLVRELATIQMQMDGSRYYYLVMRMLDIGETLYMIAGMAVFVYFVYRKYKKSKEDTDK